MEICPIPTMRKSTVNISQLVEKICRKLKPVCTAMVEKRMLFLPNLVPRTKEMITEFIRGAGLRKRKHKYPTADDTA